MFFIWNSSGHLVFSFAIVNVSTLPVRDIKIPQFLGPVWPVRGTPQIFNGSSVIYVPVGFHKKLIYKSGVQYFLVAS